ncbi:alpha beta-hydrolase [Hygrophoropsis aurantiaca]|uniref:Alpha beta-hydrolase n=1 Tax=Hygrophoropsis aurantiaca TaxID=72124 RepID=A0ACB8AA04_9AGAM|nr:alpha beta-hydrolase [Hygrophoropsis aurantiaca]
MAPHAQLRMLASAVSTVFFILMTSVHVNAQTPPSSYPQIYPGMPQGDYSPEWQAYFQVTEALPNVTWPIARNWAGNIPVQRENHPNDTLFFWAFENSNGSMTTAAGSSDEPWGIWLNGGPGSSSLVGFLFENGPLHVSNNYSLFENEYSWSTIADYVWIDQPVGVGFGTADSDGYILDEDQMATDFFGFLENLVKVFPSLATRPLHLTGESYAGMYIPYITKAYFQMDHPPVKLAKIAIGDGAIASAETFELLPVVSVLETYPQIIGYDEDVLEYFREQTHLCGYDLNLTYPQDGHFPTLGFIQGGDNSASEAAGASSRYKSRQGRLTKDAFMAEAEARYASKRSVNKWERLRARDSWKRGLEGMPNGIINSWYGCDLYDEMLDYAINYTFPWSLSKSSGGMFDVYNIPDALNPEAPMDGSVFLNDPRTRAAIHAPTSKNWAASAPYPFGNNYQEGDPSIEPMAFLTDLATNATAQNISVVIYSGNDDSLVPHYSSEVTIQNTTFGGIQGFTRKPSTPWYNDANEFAGIVHQERGWTYILVQHAGHLVGYTNPTSALVLMREFVYGNNQTGLVTSSSGTIKVIGGENSTLAELIMPGQEAIYYGAGTTESTYYFPTATIAAWEKFIATATAEPITRTPKTLASSAASPRAVLMGDRALVMSVFVVMFMMFL